jgi:hypothetical protein
MVFILGIGLVKVELGIDRLLNFSSTHPVKSTETGMAYRVLYHIKQDWWSSAVMGIPGRKLTRFGMETDSMRFWLTYPWQSNYLNIE